ncbi:uncharacterized protein LY89DRAFT_267882 [Mollisia scopiformis]|uniref:Uncharacterized protein n=1 Tax=Mollisia scopiformis TaxID=149040 RepID=A0A132BCM5_MOLSC|nr:uncharacterized protein LY89DRAFT_267882 [Mollisia scopiformis]KUJ10003.1 hypothetical protein LY89DRAFT_267882 [Mollisia scopiformis]
MIRRFSASRGFKAPCKLLLQSSASSSSKWSGLFKNYMRQKITSNRGINIAKNLWIVLFCSSFIVLPILHVIHTRPSEQEKELAAAQLSAVQSTRKDTLRRRFDEANLSPYERERLESELWAPLCKFLDMEVSRMVREQITTRSNIELARFP